MKLRNAFVTAIASIAFFTSLAAHGRTNDEIATQDLIDSLIQGEQMYVTTTMTEAGFGNVNTPFILSYSQSQEKLTILLYDQFTNTIIGSRERFLPSYPKAPDTASILNNILVGGTDPTRLGYQKSAYREKQACVLRYPYRNPVCVGYLIPLGKIRLKVGDVLTGSRSLCALQITSGRPMVADLSKKGSGIGTLATPNYGGKFVVKYDPSTSMTLVAPVGLPGHAYSYPSLYAGAGKLSLWGLHFTVKSTCTIVFHDPAVTEAKPSPQKETLSDPDPGLTLGGLYGPVLID